MLRSLAAATLPLFFTACVNSAPERPPAEPPLMKAVPVLKIEFLGARTYQGSFGYINPAETAIQRQIAPGRALFIDKTTLQRFQFNCATLGKIIDESLIDLNLSTDSKERRALKANMDQVLVGYTILKCGRNLDA